MLVTSAYQFKEEMSGFSSMRQAEAQHAQTLWRKGADVADDVWELRMAHQDRDAQIRNLQVKNELLEEQLVGLHAAAEECKRHHSSR